MNQKRERSLKGIASLAGRLTVIGALVLLSTVLLLASPVQAQPTIVPSSLPEAQVDVPYTATLVALSDSPPCTWAIYAGSLPPELTLNTTTGSISGTPTTAGTYTFYVTAEDGDGTSPPQGFFITVTSTPITFLTTSLTHATEGSDYLETIEISGGISPYTWSIISGTLPSGLTLSTTYGEIWGEPDEGTAGTHSFTVKVTDSSTVPSSAQRSFSLVVETGYYASIVSIAPNLLAGEAGVFVDEAWVADLEGGESKQLNFEPETNHTITVDSTVSHPTATNVRFVAEVDRVVVSEISPNAYFDYDTEYYIDFKTNPTQIGQLTGSGWYREDYALRTSAPSEFEDTADTQYRFSHWQLPSGETVRDEDLSITITMPGSMVANYDTYYKLTIASPYGEVSGGTWHKAGSEAQWAIDPPDVSMSGVLGAFGGRLTAVNPSGTETMDGPQTINVSWESDYTRPILFISLIGLAIGLGAFFAYRRSKAPRPAPAPATTVVMIGDTAKQASQATRQQLLEKLSELLERYEDEIRTSGEAKEIESTKEGRMLAAPGVFTEDESLCNFTGRKLLRVVASTWRQVEAKTKGGSAVVWERDIYNEWEILTCLLPRGHKGTHQGSFQIVYTLLNTVTEEKTYEPEEEVSPPTPHFTDGIPEVRITADQVIPPEQLPPETIS